MKHIFTLPRITVFILLSVFTTLSYAQTGSLTGKVVSEKNEGLIGATVKVKNSAIGGACDIDGNYKVLNVPVGEQKFVISYIGFLPKEITLNIKEGDNVQPDIILKEDKMQLNEVVVVGYGTQVKHDMSSSVSSVKAADIADKPVYNFTSSLQGKASGVQVTTDNGAAGSSTSIRIRGPHSLSSSAEPLYVIDGVPIIAFDVSRSKDAAGYNTSPLATINPNDIEDIEILKDAAATAIYGARGANGVVIVTTKSGKEGKTKIDFSYNTGFSMPANKIHLLNGDQYKQLYHEAYSNDSVLAAANHASVAPYSLPNANLLSSKQQHENTNWLDQMFRMGYFNDANVTASGGNAKTNYFVGLGIRDEKSFLKQNDFQRVSFRGNLNSVASKYFDFGISTNLTRTDNKYVNTSGSGGLGTAQSTALPYYPVYDSSGHYFLGNQNPLAQVNYPQNDNVTWRTIDNVFANIHFLKYFTIHNEFGIDLINTAETTFLPKQITGDSAIAIDRHDLYFTYNYSGSIDFKKDISDKHFFEALVGANATATIEKYSYIQVKGLPSDNYTEPQAGAAIIQTAVAGTGRQFDFASFFARLNYKYVNRHLFQVSFRADGSSRFAPSNRWGFFPAASYGWIASEERFFKTQHVMSFLKFRASAGLIGNAEFSSDFAYLNTYSSGNNYGGQIGFSNANSAVNNLGWESTLKTDFGLDFGFLEGRLSGLFDVYYDRTYNMLIQGAPLTPSSGYTSVTRNLGSMQNIGVELQLTSYNFKPKSKVQWKTTLNFGLNRNKVLDLGGIAEVSGTNYGDNRAIVGQSTGVWYIAEWAGVDPQTGKPMIYDYSGNKVEATATSTVKYRKVMGRPYPLFYGGLGNNFSYKGLELDIFLTYSVGNSIYDDAGKRQVGNMSYGWNQDVLTLNRWQKPGDITDVPKLSLVNNYDLNTSKDLHDGSYLKLKTITLAYNIPQKFLSKAKMRQFRIFVSAQNIATVTKYRGWDPETNRESSGAITQGVTYLATPQARTFSIGFSFGL